MFWSRPTTSPMLAARMPATPSMGEVTRAKPTFRAACSTPARARSTSASARATLACLRATLAWAVITPARARATLPRAATMAAWLARLFWIASSSSCWLTEPSWASGV